MAEIGAALDRLGAKATAIPLSSAHEERVRELVKELEAIYHEEEQKLAS